MLTSPEIFGLLEPAADLLTSFAAGLRRPAATGAAEVAVHAGDDALDAVRPAWRALEFSGARPTAFQSLAIAEAACETHRRKGETPLIVVVSRRGSPVALFPTVVASTHGLRGVRFLGDPLIQYGDVLATPEATADDFLAASRKIAHAGRAHYIHLRKVRADAHIAPFLDGAAHAVARYHAPCRSLEGAAPLAAHKVREIRRFRRRLAEQGEVAFRILRDDQVANALRTALAHKRDWLGSRGLASAVIGDADWEAGLYKLAANPSGTIRLTAAQIEIGGRPAAIEIAIEDGCRWHAFLGAIDPAFAKAGPGHVQMEETIAWCAAQGYAEYDLLAPADDYKRSIANAEVDVCDYAAATSLRGKAAVSALRAVPAVKESLALLPNGARAKLIRWLRGVAR